MRGAGLILSGMLALWVLVFPAGALAGGRLVFVADEWPPFNTTPLGQKQGFMVDMAREILAEHGYELEYRVMPWTRAVQETRKGQYHAAIGASRTDAPDFVFPSEPFALTTMAFFVRQDNPWRFVGRDDVRTQILGVIEGYDYREWLLSYIHANREDPFRVQIMHGDAPLERNLRKLLLGRVDVVVDNEAAIAAVARDMGIRDQILCAGTDHEVSEIHIAFSPARPESGQLAELLAEGIRRMRASGRLRQILDGYGLRDWKEPGGISPLSRGASAPAQPVAIPAPR